MKTFLALMIALVLMGCGGGNGDETAAVNDDGIPWEDIGPIDPPPSVELCFLPDGRGNFMWQPCD